MPSSELRREIKFALPEGDLETLRSVLDVNCRRVRYGGDTSRVTSLYFDDARLSACQDNFDGAPRRFKLRLRWYDSELPKERAFVEMKWREGQATGKRRMELRLTEALETTRFSSLARTLGARLTGVVALALRDALVTRPEPVLLVEYERTYYESTELAVPLRVTIDSDLAFYAQAGRRFLARQFPTRLRGLVIVEGKAPVGSEHLLGPLLHPLSLRVTRSSKYVMGCRSLGLV